MSKSNRFDNIRDYAVADLAATHRLAHGSQRPVDDQHLNELGNALEQDGYVIVPSLVDADWCHELASELRTLFVYDGGRNSFEGFRTRRLYRIFEKTLSCNPLIEHPLILGLLDRILMPNYLLSQCQAIDIHPGEDAQMMHYDDGFYPPTRPRPPLSVATIFALDPFTETNGATRLVPKSHRWEQGRVPSDEDELVYATMPTGSVLILLGTLWHGGGANDSDSSRLAVTGQYCEPWLRTQENYCLGISPATAARCSEPIQRMLGYSILKPFAGMVDGKHPRRLLPSLDE
ncbi:MAG: phytanoyl-CoA dioxygenase family protein [Myxococcota bacterium]